MSKRLSEKEKILILNSFKNGKYLDEIAEEFYCTKATIVRNLKRTLGEEKYKYFLNINKKLKSSGKDEENNSQANHSFEEQNYLNDNSKEFLPITPFTEIIPLEYDIQNEVQKDLSSVPISEIDFPKVVYMIVDKKIELETKYLKEYPDWQFLSQDELSRKTIQIFFDLKNAKRFCNKEQKVIKVPNTNVFRIVAPILLNKGISRIVTDNQLIAL